jgi:hypothetical protein
MKIQAKILGAVLAAMLANPSAMADPPLSPPGGAIGVVPPTPPVGQGPLPDVIPPRPDGLPPGTVTSPWIDYTRPDCCGPFGGGPIGFEYYGRTGISLPVANGILRDTLRPGWMSQIGARTLFFNPETTRAWAVDAGLSFTYNEGRRSDLTYIVPFLNPVGIPPVPTLQDVTVTTRDFQRWSFNMAVGRDWFIGKPAYEPGWHWRSGWDIGGRWGYARLLLNDISTNPPNIGFRRKGDVYGALALGIHQEIEYQLCNGTSIFGGIRGEWAYNWTDIVPPAAGRDLQDVNILINWGWRY